MAMALSATLLWLLSGCFFGNKEPPGMEKSAENFVYSCSTESLQGLLPEVRSALDRVALAYRQAEGERIRVSSAKRSLRHCAELMAAFEQLQLEGMYCRNGYPDYIRELVAARHKKDAPLTGEEAYQILCQRQYGYISWHLVGGAVDIARGVRNQELLKRLLQENNFSVLDEQEFGIPCFHATYRGLAKTIVRE